MQPVGAMCRFGARRAVNLNQAIVILTVAVLLSGIGYADDLNLSPTRPVVANSATIQDKGVLQVEIGYDVFP